MISMYSESGSVYVRERGELYCVNRDVGENLFSKPQRLFQRDLSLTLCTGSCDPITRQTTDHYIFTYNSQGSLCYTAKALLDITLHFIADHVEHVDSLVGFPEEMAHRLFVAAEEKQKFSDSSTSARALQVFSEGYGELLLSSLCLRDRRLLVSERLEEIRVFHQLESLDLFGCRLGDDHDIFRHITSEAFSRLVRLFLGNNCLSDKGFQRLTAPIRVMKKGLENLQQLDVSGNPLTEKGLRYLMCFKNLRELDISGTRVKSDAWLRSLFRSRMGMVMSAEPLQIFSHCECRTEGWAEEVINQWERKASQLRKKDAKPRTNALQFYGREKFVRENIHSNSDLQKIQNEWTTMHFYKPMNLNSTGQQTGHDADSPSGKVLTTQVGRKRRLCNEREEKEETSPPAKRQPVGSFTADDMDLLNSY